MSLSWKDLPKATFECWSCETVAGCARHAVFKCETCGNATWWSDGGADDRPNDCSECWAKWFDPRRDIAAALASYLEGEGPSGVLA